MTKQEKLFGEILKVLHWTLDEHEWCMTRRVKCSEGEHRIYCWKATDGKLCPGCKMRKRAEGLLSEVRTTLVWTE
jgi:hypothetical protein